MKVNNHCRVTVKDFGSIGKPPFFLDRGLRLGENAGVERPPRSAALSRQERKMQRKQMNRIFSRPAPALLVLCALAVALAFGACDKSITGSSDGGGNYAVVVGIANYRVPSFNLRYADDDALDYFNALVQGSNWDPSTITVLLNGAATKSAIISAINSVGGSLSSGDKFVFYFSGHGTKGPDVDPIDEADGLDEYIVPHDALSNSHANDIRDDELELIFASLPTRNILGVFDSSFSGGVIKSRLAPSGRVKYIDRGIPAAATGKSIDGLFKDLDVVSGMITQTASAANESPLESNILRNGVFTYYLVEGMAGPANPEGGAITAQEAFAYAAPRSTAFFSGMHPQQRDNRGSPYTLIIK
jgi:hypothetical protein